MKEVKSDSNFSFIGYAGEFKPRTNKYNSNKNSYHESSKKYKIKCYNCGGEGHVASLCATPKDNQRKDYRKNKSDNFGKDNRRNNFGNEGTTYKNNYSYRKDRNSQDRDRYNVNTSGNSRGNANNWRNSRNNSDNSCSGSNLNNDRSEDDSRKNWRSNAKSNYNSARALVAENGENVGNSRSTDSLAAHVLVAQCISEQTTSFVAHADCSDRDELPIREGMIDGGASFHLTGDKGILERITEISNPNIILGICNEFTITPKFMGEMHNVTLNINNEPTYSVLKDVRYDEGMRLTLISEGKITEAGCRLEVEKEWSNVIRKSDNKSIMVGRRRNNFKWVQFLLKKDFNRITLDKILNSSMFIAVSTPAMEKSSQ